MTKKFLAFTAAILTTAVALASPPIDGINTAASPARTASTSVFYGSDGVGWYYTPATSYNLDGIFGNFEGTFGSTTPQTVTVQIQTERPLNGGTVLRQGTFSATPSDGGNLGATFTPIALSAGTTYFVDYLNIRNVGINLATWDTDAHGNPEPAGGATVNLGAFYRENDPDTQFATLGTNYGTDSTGTINVAGGEPILSFTGTPIPEPSSAGLIALFSLVLARRRSEIKGI